MPRLSDLTIRQHMVLMVAITVLYLSGLATWMLKDFRERFAETRIAQAEATINSVLAMLTNAQDLVDAGAITEEFARRTAMETLRSIRYGGGEGYIAILDDRLVTIMHPIHPEIDGSDMADFQDADGRYIAREANAIGRQGGVGINRYRFKNPDTGEPDLKTSAIARFDPWGWTLIAGVFDRRVDQAIADITGGAIAFLMATILASSLCAIWVAARIVRPLKELTTVMSKTALGALDLPVPFLDRKNEMGSMALALSVFRNNSVQLKNMTAELEDALKQEKELSAQQRQFVSMVSHEFRTPLAVIHGLSGALQRRRARMSDEKIDDSLTKISNSVQRLVRLMESTLTASKLEAGTIELKRVDFDLSGLLRQIVRERRAISSHAALSIDIDALPERIALDDRLMYSVFDNLVSNAIKYGGDEPKVDVRGRVENDDVVVSVSDNGVGIPPDEIDKIGQRYFRASTSNGVQGTGIGLNMVSLVADMHGGAMKVESEVGVGSTFTIRFPLSPTAPRAPSLEAAVGAS